MERNQAGGNRVSKAIVLPTAMVLSGLITGAFLGAAGGILSSDVRFAGASLLAVVSIVFGSLEIAGRRVWLLQYNHETPQRWLEMGPMRWAVVNGLALGFGATSRIGFWLWYTIPLGALLFARPDLGAAIYGTYSIVRGMAVWVLILGGSRISKWLGEGWGSWVTRHMSTARVVAASQLVFIGTVVAIVVGL